MCLSSKLARIPYKYVRGYMLTEYLKQGSCYICLSALFKENISIQFNLLHNQSLVGNKETCLRVAQDLFQKNMFFFSLHHCSIKLACSFPFFLGWVKILFSFACCYPQKQNLMNSIFYIIYAYCI